MIYKYKIVSLIAILNSLLSIGLSILLIKFVFPDNAYYGKILGGLIPLSISGLVLLLYTFYKGKKFIDIKYWKYALIISLPLIAHNLSGIINAQSDRILLNKYIGASETGIYSFAYNIGMVISVIWTSMNQAWIPWFFEKMKNNEFKNIKKRAENYRDIFILLYSVILLISPEIIKLMADQAYWDGLYIIPFIFMAYYFQLMYSFEVSVEFFSKKTHLIASGTILAAAVNVLLNMIFIPIYGKTAAAITTVISYFFLFVFHYLITNFILKIKIFSFVFHLKSIIYVFGTTIVFILFQRYFFMRIVMILFLGVVPIIKYQKNKLKNGK